MMTTSFVAINHGNFALMTAAADQEEAVAACQAGYSYAWYALEHDKRFGKGFAQGTQPSQAQLDDLSSLFTITVVDSNTLTAKLLGPDGEDRDASFTLEIQNNLPADSVEIVPAIPAAADHPQVPPDCVFLRITGTAGGVTRVLETMLTYAPLVDSIASSDNQIHIDSTDGIVFDSKDRFRNFVRSNGRINLQNQHKDAPIEFRWEAMEKELFLKLKATTGAPDADVKAQVEDILRGRKGDLKAKGDILMRGKSTTERPEFRLEQERASNGRISPNSTREHQLLDIKFDDFRLKDDTTKEFAIKEGLYVFGSADYHVTYRGRAVWKNGTEEAIADAQGEMDMSFPALERKIASTNSDGGISGTTTVERWVNSAALPKEGASTAAYSIPNPPYAGDGVGWEFDRWLEEPTIVALDYDAGDNEGDSEGSDRASIHELDNRTARLDDIAAGPVSEADHDKVVIDIERAEFRVEENVLLKSGGSFGVLAERDRFRTYGESFRRALDAKLKLGIKKESMFSATTENGELPSAVQASGAVRVRNVSGRGALVAKENLTLAAGGDTSNDELALYSEKDITLDPQAEIQGNNDTESEATVFDGAPVDSTFRGLVYARGDFNIGNSNIETNILVEGSLVARNAVNILNGKKVRLTYNPIISKRMLKDRPDYDVRLERQSYNLF